MKKKTFFSEIKRRWRANTPLFWKKVMRFAIVFGSASISVYTVNTSMDLGLPDIIIDVCRYSIAVCAALGLSSKLTTTTINA